MGRARILGGRTAGAGTIIMSFEMIKGFDVRGESMSCDTTPMRLIYQYNNRMGC